MHTFLQKVCTSLQKSNVSAISADFAEICRKCTPFCRNLKFLQRGAHLSAEIAEILDFCRNLQKVCTSLQKSKVSAISADFAEICRRCAPLCRNLRFLQNLQKGTPFCRNIRFLQKPKSAISAEITEILDFCRKVHTFLQKS